MPKAKVLDLKKKEPKSSNPLIEIMGPIDIGKTPIAQLVAKRINATLVSFPVLDPFSVTGRGLLSSLSTNARGLEQQPNWWAHMYAANLYENISRVESALEKGPVVITNYTNSFICWMKALNVDVSRFVTDLPSPNISYVLCGSEGFPTMQPKFDFSIYTALKIKRTLEHTALPKVIKVTLSSFQHKFTHIYANSVSCAITNSLKEKYNLYLAEKELYTIDSFLLKKSKI